MESEGLALASLQPSPAMLLAPVLTSALVPFSAAPGPVVQAPVSQSAYLKSGAPDDGDQFGFIVDISGDTIVVGKKGDDSSSAGINGSESDNGLGGTGAASVFIRNGSTWTQQAFLKAAHPDYGDSFGYFVAIDGDTIAVSAPDEDSASAGVNGDQLDNSLSDAGAVYVFRRTSGVWAQEAYLKASTPGADAFGRCLDISGDTIVVGSPSEDSDASGVNGDESNDNSPGSGAAWVFVRQGTTWTQQAYLKASNTDDGDQFGTSVAIHGDTIAVAAYLEDGSSAGVNGPDDNLGDRTGAVYVFERNAGTWSQQAHIKSPDVQDLGVFGKSVALGVDRLVVGAPGESVLSTVDTNGHTESITRAGAVHHFERRAGAWVHADSIKAGAPDYKDDFGNSVSLSGDSLIVGANHEGGDSSGIDGDQLIDGSLYSGAAYAFRRSVGHWGQIAYVKASNHDTYDGFGHNVAIDGEWFVVGSPGESSGASGVNGNQADNSVDLAGAAYVFEFPVPSAIPLCLGDGSDVFCPCVNFGRPGEGCENSTGRGALLRADGSASVAADDLSFVLTGGRGNQPSLLVQGEALTTVPFRDGLLCMGNPTERMEVVMLDGSGNGVTTSSIVTSGNIAPGAIRYYQQWYRDPGPLSPCGAGSNLSQALLVSWH